MSDELLRRGRALAYRMREDQQGHDASLIEGLCDALENATRLKTAPTRSSIAVFDPR